MALAVEFAKTGVEFDVANRVFFRLYQASNLMHKQGTRYVGKFRTTTQQWAVLGALARPLVRLVRQVRLSIGARAGRWQ